MQYSEKNHGEIFTSTLTSTKNDAKTPFTTNTKLNAVFMSCGFNTHYHITVL